MIPFSEESEGAIIYTIKRITLIFYFSMIPTFMYSQTFELYEKAVFGISIPTDWEEIPKEMLDGYSKNLLELAPDAPVPNFDYGFQAGDSETWFSYPYILISIKNTGRLSKKELLSLPDLSIDEYIDELGEAMENITSEVDMGQMYYDKASNIIWMHLEASVIGVGEIHGLNAMILTERGYIAAAAYSFKKDFTSYQALFRLIQKSILPIPSLRYESRITDSIPMSIRGINWAEVIAAAIIGGIIFLFQSLKKDDS